MELNNRFEVYLNDRTVWVEHWRLNPIYYCCVPMHSKGIRSKTCTFETQCEIPNEILSVFYLLGGE